MWISSRTPLRPCIRKNSRNTTLTIFLPGRGSQTFRELTTALAAAQQKRGPVFLPFAEKPFAGSVNFLSNRKGSMAKGASLLEGIHAVSGVEYGVRQHASDL